ncbi:hypothetical protein [Mycobacterium mantenii]|uniref:hypothetical protein n=1 Tax=Mycobacterium mantenii TaxID=560555 RepID=UPI000AF55F89|nr:hypothetical protein [Mycobacterium mantenii]
MATGVAAKIIVLQTHSAWNAAQLRAREREESMRRHPSSSAGPDVAEGLIEQPARRLPEDDGSEDDPRPWALRVLR